MNVVDYAERILLGRTLAEKLTPPDLGPDFWKDSGLRCERDLTGQRPERERTRKLQRSSRPGSSSFLRQLESLSVRSELVHSFANHELQAIELMALALLRFREAPLAFRKGVLATLIDEQRHFNLYLSRLRSFGADWGDFETSYYFWDTLSKMRSPLEYVTAMGLTFEQANLDYARAYSAQFRQVGDLDTAEVLNAVLEDEKRHVKHGLHWFREWVSEDESANEFEAHRKHLIKPLTLVRAKGFEFSRELRESVGFTSEYIDQLAVSGGSKGRPPAVYFYNPRVEYEVAGDVAAEEERLPVERDLELLPLFLARESDIVCVEERPDEALMARYARLGVALPDFRCGVGEIWEEKWAGVAPWGWSSQTAKRFEPFRSRQVRTSGAPPWFSAEDCGRFEGWHSKLVQQEAFARWYARNENELNEILKASETGWRETSCESIVSRLKSMTQGLDSKRGEASSVQFVVKSPFGLSGMQMKVVDGRTIEQENIRKWIERVMERRGAVWVEPFFDRVCDLAIQCEIANTGKVEIMGLRRAIVQSGFAYRGTFLDSRLSSLSEPVLRFVREHQHLAFDWAKAIGAELYSVGYRGPFGIDQFVFRRPDQTLGWKLCSEVNLRYTMGRVALEIERKVARSRGGVFWLSRVAHEERVWNPSVAVRDGEAVALTREDRARVLIPYLVFGGTSSCDQIRVALEPLS